MDDEVERRLGVVDRHLPVGTELVDAVRLPWRGPLGGDALGRGVTPDVQAPAVVVAVRALVVHGREALRGGLAGEDLPAVGAQPDLRCHRRVDEPVLVGADLVARGVHDDEADVLVLPVGGVERDVAEDAVVVLAVPLQPVGIGAPVHQAGGDVAEGPQADVVDDRGLGEVDDEVVLQAADRLDGLGRHHGGGLRRSGVTVEVVDHGGHLDGGAGRQLLGVDGDPVRRVVVGARVRPLTAVDAAHEADLGVQLAVQRGLEDQRLPGLAVDLEVDLAAPGDGDAGGGAAVRQGATGLVDHSAQGRH